jgi:hypothetical protein
MKPDGNGRRKITPERILDVHSVSRDGHWILASAPNPSAEQTTVTKAFRVDGTESVKVCLGYCQLVWDPDGNFVYLYFRPCRIKAKPFLSSESQDFQACLLMAWHDWKI